MSISSLSSKSVETEGNKAAAILAYTERLYDEISQDVRDIIVEVLRNTYVRQCDIADFLLKYLHLKEECRSSLRRLIGKIAKDALSYSERKERALAVQRRVQRDVFRDTDEYSEYARRGAHTRQLQCLAEGKNAAGHDFWTKEEDDYFLCLLLMQENLRTDHRHYGKPDYVKTQALYNKRFQYKPRSIDAMRKRGRELLARYNSHNQAFATPKAILTASISSGNIPNFPASR